MGMSPAKAARQRSPMMAFWRWNSLDSSPPTQVITGQRVAGIMKLPPEYLREPAFPNGAADDTLARGFEFEANYT